MTERVLAASISAEPLDVDECIRQVQARDAGAIVAFNGIVRDHDEGRSVVFLEYEAHPSAVEVLQAVAASIAAEFPGVTLAVHHRTGRLEVGDVALVAAVASAHRAAAFAACSALVDRVKQQVPIWKRQHFADGTSEWVGSLG